MKRNLTSPPRRSGACGFTLLELLVSMVITTLIVGILLSVTATAIDGWQVNTERVRATRHAKIALDQMSKDFESMQLRRGNSFEWLYAKVDDGVGDGAVTGGDAAQFALFTAATDRYNGQVGKGGVDKGGDVSAVGYRLVYKDPVKNDTGEFSVFSLYRKLVDPDVAFAELLGREGLMVGMGGAEGPFQKHMDEAGSVSNFVCENIYDLSLSFLVEYEGQEGGATVTKLRRLSVIDTSGGSGVDTLRIKGNGIFVEPIPDGEEELRRGRIVNVEIGVSVITERAMNVIRGGGLSADEVAEIVAKSTYRYTKTTNLTHF